MENDLYRAGRSWGPLSAWLAGLLALGSGLVSIYSVIGDSLPERTALLQRIFPLEFLHLSRSLVLLIGFVLVVSSINLVRRKRRAYWVVIVLGCASIVFHLTKGIDYEEASMSAALVLVLVYARRHFTVRSGPPNLRLAVLRTGLAAFLVLGYGVSAFWLLEKSEFGVNFHIGDALAHTLAIMSMVGDPQLTPQTPYAEWFVGSVYSLTFAAIFYAGFAFFRPVAYRLRTLPNTLARAAAILREHGSSSLGFFTVRPDKSFYFSPSGRSYVAYRVGNGYAVALGDPVGPADDLEAAARGFIELCRDNDWGVAIHQAPQSSLDMYRRLGLRAIRIGDEAVVDVTAFTLEGSARKRLRATVRRFEREGYRFVVYPVPVDTRVLDQAKEVSDEWLELPGRRERGFSVGVFDTSYLAQTPLVAVVDARGRMIAFANRIPSYRAGEATIDLMRHRRDAPNSTMDFLFCKLFEACRAEGFRSFSMGLAPFAKLGEGETATREEHAVRAVLSRLDFVFSFEGVQRFKAKYASSWEPRYLVYQNPLRLPAAGLALAAVSELKQPAHTGGWTRVSRVASAAFVLMLTACGAAGSRAVFSTRPLPPAGKNALVLRGKPQDVYFYPAANGAQDCPKILFLCGDGGWEGVAPDMAQAMADGGFDVYALDTKRYLESFTTDSGTLTDTDVASDIQQVAIWMSTKWRERITLVGWSEGAGLVVRAAAVPGNDSLYQGVVVFGLPEKVELGWRWQDDSTYVTGADPDEPTFNTIDWMSRVAPVPLVIIHASKDQFIPEDVALGLFNAARDPKRYQTVRADNHAFAGNIEGFYEVLTSSINWTERGGQ